MFHAHNLINFISGTDCEYAKLLAEPVYEPWCSVLFGFKNSNMRLFFITSFEQDRTQVSPTESAKDSFAYPQPAPAHKIYFIFLSCHTGYFIKIY